MTPNDRVEALVLGGDEGAARGIAVAMHSALKHLSARVEVWVLDAGISDDSRERLRHTHPDVQFVSVPADRLSRLPTKRHLTRGTYARLLIPELLPHAGRVVYLDSDVVVLRDLSPLFSARIGASPLAAVRNFETPRIGEKKTFNAGVLVFEADRWRATRFGDRVLAHLATHADTFPNLDQEALNAVAETWVELDWRWNVQQSLSWVDQRPPTELTERLVAEREVLYREAAIIHFSSTPKPWYHGCTAPGTGLWVKSLIRSGYYRPHELTTWVAGWSGKRAAGRMVRQGSTVARRLWHVLPYRARADLGWMWACRGLRPPIVRFHWHARQLARQMGDRWWLWSTHPGDLKVLLSVARGRRRVVELGTGAGWTALTLALDDPQRRVTTYDPEDWGREHYARLVPPSVRDRIEFLRAPGSAGPLQADMEQVELLYIDSAHQCDQTIEEVTAWLPHLAPGAPVVFGDFNSPRHPGVSEAIRALGLGGEQKGRLFVHVPHTGE